MPATYLYGPFPPPTGLMLLLVALLSGVLFTAGMGTEDHLTCDRRRGGIDCEVRRERLLAPTRERLASRDIAAVKARPSRGKGGKTHLVIVTRSGAEREFYDWKGAELARLQLERYLRRAVPRVEQHAARSAEDVIAPAAMMVAWIIIVLVSGWYLVWPYRVRLDPATRTLWVAPLGFGSGEPRDVRDVVAVTAGNSPLETAPGREAPPQRGPVVFLWTPRGPVALTKPRGRRPAVHQACAAWIATHLGVPTSPVGP
jgi:hypothetical protein